MVRAFLKVLCFSNVWVSGCLGFFFYFGNAPFLAENELVFFSLFLFLVSFATYFFLRRAALNGPNDQGLSNQVVWMRTHSRHLSVVVAFALISACFLLFYYVPFSLILYCLPALPIVVFYQPFLWFRFSLRSLAIFKPLFITLVIFWLAFFPGFFRAMADLKDIEIDYLGVFFEYLGWFFFVFSTVFVFDIRDAEADRKSGMVTLAVKMGPDAARNFLRMLFVFSGLVVLPGLWLDLSFVHGKITLLICSAAGFMMASDRSLCSDELDYLIWYDLLLAIPALLILTP